MLSGAPIGFVMLSGAPIGFVILSGAPIGFVILSGATLSLRRGAQSKGPPSLGEMPSRPSTPLATLASLRMTSVESEASRFRSG